MYPTDLNAFSQSAVMIHGDWHCSVADIDEVMKPGET